MMAGSRRKRSTNDIYKELRIASIAEGLRRQVDDQQRKFGLIISDVDPIGFPDNAFGDMLDALQPGSYDDVYGVAMEWRATLNRIRDMCAELEETIINLKFFDRMRGIDWNNTSDPGEGGG